MFRNTSTLLAATALTTMASVAAAVCTCFPCPDCEILNEGQLNFVIMDRAEGEVRLIPNIRFSGNAREFAIVVPTPTIPEFAEASGNLWRQASDLTRPSLIDRRLTQRFDNGLSCGEEDLVFVNTDSAEGGDEDEVIVHGSQTVGAFLVTSVSSSDPGALVGWLRANDYEFSAEDSSKIAPLAEANWIFTTMRLDTSQPGTDVPAGGWNNNVDPVEFRFQADDLVIPLPYLSINRADRVPMVFYVLDDHRADLEGFETRYANRLSASEHEAILETAPAVGRLVAPGKMLTRLDRTFFRDEEFAHDIRLERSASDDEFREGVSEAQMILQSWPVQVLWLALVLGIARRRFRLGRV